MNLRLLLLLSLLAFSVAEKFEKIDGTWGEFADIIVDNNNRWYIIKDRKLYYSEDKGKTLNKIEIPSKEPVNPRLGIDKFNNVYVQDDKMTVFLISRSLNNSFEFEEITLKYAGEKLLNRPVAVSHNDVYFATKSGMMHLKNSHTKTKNVPFRYNVNDQMTQMVPYSSTEKYIGKKSDGIFYSGGHPEYRLFEQHDFYAGKLVFKLREPIKSLNSIKDHIFYIKTNSRKSMGVLIWKEESGSVVKVENIDVSNIGSDNDFVIHSPMHGNKMYVYTNIDNKGTLYGLNEIERSYYSNRYHINVTSTHKLDNARLICAVLDDNKIYFGTSDGVYQLIDIQENHKYA